MRLKCSQPRPGSRRGLNNTQQDYFQEMISFIFRRFPKTEVGTKLKGRSLAMVRSRLVIFRFRFPFHHFRQELQIMKKLFAVSLSLAALVVMATTFSARAAH